MSAIALPQGFATLNLPQSILTTLDRLGFVTPTPVQREAIPPALEGHDVVGVAETGTGKTLAFGLPMVARLQKGEVGLVLAPTRELAQQIEETFLKLGVRTALLVGGASMGMQVARMRTRPSVIIATPGRLLDHLDHRVFDLRRVTMVVLDEADRMLDMGFAPDMRRILAQVPAEHQTMLFSATMPKEIVELSKQHLVKPRRIEIQRDSLAASSVEQELAFVSHAQKPDVLYDLLKDHEGTVLVFTKTRHGARKVAKAVRRFGHTAAELHSDRTLPQRRAALHGFKSGQYRVLVATDIAARGIDVKEIEVVINYDLPLNPLDYVHRIGRTGRAGASGRAITIATPEQKADVLGIERTLKQQLSPSPRTRLSFERTPVAQRPPKSANNRARGRWTR